jgi:hypothetical protein
MDITINIEDRRQVVREFAEVINRNSLENDSNTPDYVLAEYLVSCLENWNNTIELRHKHRDPYGATEK